MKQKGFHQLIANRVCRIKRGHRFLKDHRNPVAAQFAHIPIGCGLQIDTFKIQNLRRTLRLLGQKSHDRKRCQGLATT